MKRTSLILSILLLTVPATCFAGGGRGLSYTGFSGGMLLHTGYLSGGNVALTTPGGTALPIQKMTGMPTGLGGAGRIHLGDYLRVGGEGYVSTLVYGDHGSTLRIGWGGILADCIWRFNEKWAVFAGATIGGGSAKNLTLTNKAPEDFVTEENASYRKYAFMTAVPFAGVEFAASRRVHLVLKADHMLSITGRKPDFPYGPRIYFGFAFYRMKH